MTGFDADPRDALALLGACPAYAATPLRALPGLASEGGVASIRVKDETARMGLGSFKALGGVYAVADLLRQRLGGAARPEALVGERAREAARTLTVACASAGNHGLAVAAGAAVFGARAVIYLAQTVPEGFAERLRAKGAQVVRAGAVYDEAMARAMEDARANGWTLVSDSSWQGYRTIPETIMRGYCVMAGEIADACRANGDWPSHVFLQAGVGGLAAAVAAHIRAHWDVQPHIAIAEPDRAPCLKASVEAGRPVRADGPVSNMGRLDCKEPSLVAFEVLRAAADRFALVTDEAATGTVALLARHGVRSTPSGVAGLAAALDAGLPGDARILFIASEGDG